MSSFEDRKKNFENKFAHDEELKFKVNSKRNKYLVLLFFGTVIFFSLLLPVGVLSYWLIRGISNGNPITGSLAGIAGSLTAATVTSFFAMIIATPIVVMISQYKSKLLSKKLLGHHLYLLHNTNKLLLSLSHISSTKQRQNQILRINLLRVMNIS